MHQTQSCDELSSVDVHLLVQEDKVHLEKDEDQLKTDSQEPERQLISIPGIVCECCDWRLSELLLTTWTQLLYLHCYPPIFLQAPSRHR